MTKPMTDERIKDLRDLCDRENYQGIVDSFYSEIRRARREIRCLREENERLRRFVSAVDKAFESNKNFMWGRGLWSTVSKIKTARAFLDGEEK